MASTTTTGMPQPNYARKLARPELESETLKRLSTVSSVRGVGQVFLEWLGIAIAIGTGTYLDAWWVTMLLVPFIAARQHALAILMHDASHYRIARSRQVNDLVGEVLMSWPLFFTLEIYRAIHLLHHRHLNTAHDPDFVAKDSFDWYFPKEKKHFALLFLRDLSGLNFPESFRRVLLPLNQGCTSRLNRLRPAFYLGTATIITSFGFWPEFLLYWLLPYATWLQLTLRIRSIAEHFEVDAPHDYDHTRTTIPTWLEKIFIASNNIYFHTEHHLYPSVPFYRLPQLHKTLMTMPDYRDNVCIANSYLSVIRHCSR